MDVTDPAERAVIDRQHMAVHGWAPCWDSYDFAACCALDPSAVHLAPGARPPVVPLPDDPVLEAPVLSSGDLPSDRARSAAYFREVGARARRRPRELLSMLAVHMYRVDGLGAWAEVLGVVLGFLRACWPEGHCVATLPGNDGGIAALGHPGGGRLISASTDGALGIWEDCIQLMSVGQGRGPVTCFACLHTGWWRPG